MLSTEGRQAFESLSIDRRLDEFLAQTLKNGPLPMSEEELNSFNELMLEKSILHNPQAY